MAGRDVRSPGARGASQSPKLAASIRASDRERLVLLDRLAVFRKEKREKEYQELLQSLQPEVQRVPKPAFNSVASSSSGPSAEEKFRILQKRRELMRSPTKLKKTLPTRLPASSGVSARGAPTASPRTPAAKERGVKGVPATNTIPRRRQEQQQERLQERNDTPQTSSESPEKELVPPFSTTEDDDVGDADDHSVARKISFSSPPLSPVRALESPPHQQLGTEDQDQHVDDDGGDGQPTDATLLPPQQQLEHQQSVSGDDGQLLFDEETAPASGDSPTPMSPSSSSASDHESSSSRGFVDDLGVTEPSGEQPDHRKEDDAVQNDQGHGSEERQDQDEEEKEEEEEEIQSADYHNPLLDSQSSTSSDIQRLEKLMWEADELILLHKGEGEETTTVVTDQISRRHTWAANGRQQLAMATVQENEEAVLKVVDEMRVTEEVQLTSELDETTVAPMMAAASSINSLEQQLQTVGATPVRRNALHVLQDSGNSHTTAVTDPVTAAATNAKADAEVEVELELETGSESDHDSGVCGHQPETPLSPDKSDTEVKNDGNDSNDDEATTLVKMHVAAPPLPRVATPFHGKERVSQPPHKSVSKFNYRKALELSLVALGLVLVDHFFPWSPVSRLVRVGFRVIANVSRSLCNWCWRVVFHPACDAVSRFLIATNDYWSPGARVLKSLGDHSYNSFTDAKSTLWASWELWWPAVQKDPMGTFEQWGNKAFTSFTTGIDAFVLRVTKPLRPSLTATEVETIASAKSRLDELTDAQQTLQIRVEEVLRVQEAWALDELESMKRRRVAYSTAVETILSDTRKTMLSVALEAKLSATERVHEFTSQLTGDLMASIQPKLDEYERLEADEMKHQQQHEEEIKKAKLQNEARLEILKLEVTKKQAAAQAKQAVKADLAELKKDKVFAEVDVMEVVENEEKAVEELAIHLSETLVDSLVAAVDDAEELVEKEEAKRDVLVDQVEEQLQGTGERMVERLVDVVAARDAELLKQHDTKKAEIERLTATRIQKLEAARRRAEEHIRQEEKRVRLAEKATQQTLRTAEEATKRLDDQLQEGKRALEQEVVTAAIKAVEVEADEMATIVVAEEMEKQEMEMQLAAEVKILVDQVVDVETKVAQTVAKEKHALGELESVSEETLEVLAAQDAKKLIAEEAREEEMMLAIADQAEQEIAAAIGLDWPVRHVGEKETPLYVGPVRAKSTEDEWLPVGLSGVFIVLAVAVAVGLYPRWRRLVARPPKDPRGCFRSQGRRRRWPRRPEGSDSDPEVVTLLPSLPSEGSSFETNEEPEPEVVEMLGDRDDGREAVGTPAGSSMATASMSTPTSVTRTLAFTSYTRRVNLMEGDDDDDEEEEEEEEDENDDDEEEVEESEEDEEDEEEDDNDIVRPVHTRALHRRVH